MNGFIPSEVETDAVLVMHRLFFFRKMQRNQTVLLNFKMALKELVISLTVSLSPVCGYYLGQNLTNNK